jgi:methionyl aminopeptidase
MIIIKNREQIAGIRKASNLAMRCLCEIEKHIHIGQDTETLNQIAHTFIEQNGAIPAPLNYRGFPKSICTSINNVVCHGIPAETDILKNGDIVNIDVTVILNGYFGDTSHTYIIGEVSEDVRHFVERSEKAMYRGIEVLKPGIKLSMLGRVISNYVSKFNYSVVRDYGGHGIGLEFHEEPFVHHYHELLYKKVILKEGMVFTVEPMINKSKNWEVDTCQIDGWTVRTADGALSAQFEHTILITANSHEILTIRG